MAAWPGGLDAPRVLLVALAAVTLVALVVVASTSTAAFGTYNPAWDGAADLREAARDAGAEAVVARSLDPYTAADPVDTVAVVLSPREAYTADEAATLRRFLAAAGTLVVADDFGAHANPLLERLGASSRIDGQLLRDERHFHRSPALPVATDVSAHPLTAGVDEVTVNHASAVEPDGATVLVRTSPFAYADANRNGALDDAERLDRYPLVTVETVGEGTLVVASNPSLFINVMLERPGNAAFVRNLFAGHGTVVLDYSHAGGFPPLALALLVLRDSMAFQLALGALGLAVIGLWSVGYLSLGARRRPESGPVTPPSLTEDEQVRHLARKHPEWDAERLRRVVRGVINHRRQPRRDE